MKPSDSPLAQSTPVSRHTRSRKRVLPEPVPPCVTDANQPAQKRPRKKPGKSEKSKSGSKSESKAKSDSKVKSDPKVKSDTPKSDPKNSDPVVAVTSSLPVSSVPGGSVSSSVLSTPPLAQPVSLSTDTTTTTTNSSGPSTFAGDVNKTVTSDSVVDVKRASQVDGSTTDDDNDAYDDDATKTYINLKQRYSSEYAEKGKLKLKITSKDKVDSKTVPKSTSAPTQSIDKPSASGTAKPKNLHQVIKEKKDIKKRSSEPTYLPFNKDARSAGNVADSATKGTKRLSSHVVVPSSSNSKPSSSSEPVQKRPKVEPQKTERPVEPRKTEHKVDSKTERKVEQGTSSRTTPPGQGSSGQSSSGSSDQNATAGGSSSRSDYVPSRRSEVRFSTRDGTVKLSSDGYRRMDFRPDAAPLKYTTSNRPHNHQT